MSDKESYPTLTVEDHRRIRDLAKRSHINTMWQQNHTISPDDFDWLMEHLAAAEQRATDAEARAERLAEAVRDLWPKVPDYKTRDLSPATFGVVNQEFSPFALTAPATQPDERAAAERELLDRLAKRILAEIVYCAPENRALAEEIARVAKIETDMILARHDATPKEKA